MRSEKFDVNNLKVAMPCPMSWDQMKGDDRTRHCSLCELNVHNVAGLSPSEIEKLLAVNEGRLCGRLFRRADGTVITRDCPVGLRKYRRRVAGIASAAFASVLSLLSVSYAQKHKDVKKVDASDIKILRTLENVGSSSIRGTLVDPNGAVIPNVQVQLLQDGKKVGSIVCSDADGQFSFEGLTEGIYQIGIRSVPGFQSLSVEHIDLKTNERQEMDLELPLDGTSVTVGLLMVDSGIDLSTNEQTTVFTRDMLDRMPGRKPPFD